MNLGTSQHVVRYSCEACQRWWVAGAEYEAHKPTCGESDRIVRELADCGPFIDDGQRCLTCDLDGADVDYDDDRWNDPANHHPTCLWRCAKALYPGEPPA